MMKYDDLFKRKLVQYVSSEPGISYAELVLKFVYYHPEEKRLKQPDQIEELIRQADKDNLISIQSGQKVPSALKGSITIDEPRCYPPSDSYSGKLQRRPKRPPRQRRG